MRFSLRMLALSGASAALAACSSTPTPPAADAIPAEVQAIIDARCGSCHGATPQFGAPMSLATYADWHRPAVTASSHEVYVEAGIRIHDAARPMPPGGALPPEELAILDAWIDAGAPSGMASTEDGGVPTAPPVGPEHLPCEPTHEFLAHADQQLDQPYHLEPGGNSGNQTLCFVYESPFGDTTQGIAFAPIIDDARVLHHWIIFGSETLPAGVEPGDVYDCGAQGMPAGAQFLQGWAPGGLNNVMPPDQGRELPGPGRYILLQIHYWNVAGYTDVNDRSGVAVCTTETPREHEVGISTLGSLAIRIPARTRQHVVSGTCTPDITEPVTIVGSGPHMHQHGVRITTEVLRAGSESDVQMLVDVPRWDFNAQTSHEAPGGELVINPGDVIRTTCVYDNPGDEMIFFGERTEDEMCFNFVAAYPAGALATAAGRPRRLCID